MPTNLPPEYFEADRKYRQAQTPEEKCAALEELLSTIPKHKGTDKLRAEFRKQLSKLKSASLSKKKTGKHDSYFHIEKEGEARVTVIGHANVGKSSLVKLLSNAEPEVSKCPFSTWKPTPGMVEVGDIRLQFIDTPPINMDYIEPELIDLIKSADLILVMIDLLDFPIQQFQETIDFLTGHKIHRSETKIIELNGKLLKDVDKSNPFVLKIGSTLEDFAGKVHHDFQEKLKTAKVWGSSVFDGQLVGRDHELHDGDIVELHI